MSEMIFDGEDKANIYERPVYNPDTPASFEEAIAESRGGDPVEWIPEADRMMQFIADTISSGGTIAMVSGEPETEGVFAGYYPVRLSLLDHTNGGIEYLERVVYATFEQVAMGHFIVPKEGLFCLDPELSV